MDSVPGNRQYTLTVCTGDGALWTYRTAGGSVFDIEAPAFEIDGAARRCVAGAVRYCGARQLSNGITETVFEAGIQERDDLTLSLIFRTHDDTPLVQTGILGGTPEVYEKINPATGRGVVSLFTNNHGTFDYFTKRAVCETWTALAGVEVFRLADGRAHVKVRFERSESGTFVLFGTDLKLG